MYVCIVGGDYSEFQIVKNGKCEHHQTVMVFFDSECGRL